MKKMKIRESGSLSKWSHIIKHKTIFKGKRQRGRRTSAGGGRTSLPIPNFANIATDQELHFKHV